MKFNVELTCTLVCIFLCSEIYPQSKLIPYKNPELPIEQRVDDLLRRMTLEEKFWQLFMLHGEFSSNDDRYIHGIFGLQLSSYGLDSSGRQNTAKLFAEKINRIQKYFIEKTRLGIPIIPFEEALHGLAAEDATSFPQSIALSASWNTKLMSKVAEAIARETKTRGIRLVLSPVLNIARDPRWGRVEETYGEDPFLTSQMGLAFTSEFEKIGIVTTPKHFVANFGDGGRDSYPVHFDERLLDEIYFPAFKACIQRSGSGAIMASYNSLSGSPATANNWLLNEKLKRDWGFKGIVISDAGAVGGANVLHFTALNYADATEKAFENGLDVILQTSFEHYPLFYEAFKSGMVSNEIIDASVARALRIKFELGLFENPYVDPEDAVKWNGNPEHIELAKQAALESAVLLKNENQLLPLSKNISKIAVIGDDAIEARLGGYSGSGINKINILDGIKRKLKDKTEIEYFPFDREAREYNVIPKDYLFSFEDGIKHIGLTGRYFNNISLSGNPVLKRIDKTIDFGWTLYSPADGIVNYDWYSVRWTGKLKSPGYGNYKIGIEGNDGYRLFINNELIIDNWKKQTYQTILTGYNFEENEEYDIKIEFFEPVGNVRFKLVWDFGVDKNWEKEIAIVEEGVRTANAAIIVAGIEEGEFRDRATLNLPGHQEELIRRAAQTGVPVVVILVGGSAVTMNGWINDVNSILDIWYPGEQGGNAVADILFGDFNPAGRLPITFPVSVSQLPLYYNHKPTGRGDDYLNLTGQPLFPFGFGLSYSSFEYSDLTFDKSEITLGDSVKVLFKLTNKGNLPGEEAAQLYIRDVVASVSRPLLELKGFQRIFLEPGEVKEIKFEITADMLSFWDKDLNKIIEPGEFKIMIGSSSKDIRLRGFFEVK